MNERLNPYFALFHGERVWQEEIKQDDIFVSETERLIKEGKVVGQQGLFGDTLLWMPEKVKSERAT